MGSPKHLSISISISVDLQAGQDRPLKKNQTKKPKKIKKITTAFNIEPSGFPRLKILKIRVIVFKRTDNIDRFPSQTIVDFKLGQTA